MGKRSRSRRHRVFQLVFGLLMCVFLLGCSATKMSYKTASLDEFKDVVNSAEQSRREWFYQGTDDEYHYFAKHHMAIVTFQPPLRYRTHRSEHPISNEWRYTEKSPGIFAYSAFTYSKWGWERFGYNFDIGVGPDRFCVGGPDQTHDRNAEVREIVRAYVDGTYVLPPVLVDPYVVERDPVTGNWIARVNYRYDHSEREKRLNKTFLVEVDVKRRKVVKDWAQDLLKRRRNHPIDHPIER